jgi:hypothetical protein
MYVRHHVKYPLVLSDFNENGIFSTYFRKILKFHEEPSSRSQVVSRRETNMTKRMDAFINFANAAKNLSGYV